jgi:hypothetical protein
MQAPARRLVHAGVINSEMSRHPDGGNRQIAATPGEVFPGYPC